MATDEQWFSYSEDDGFRRHASADEAKAAAQAALDSAGDASGDGWPEDTDSICWGEVREEAVEEVVHEHGPDCRPLAEDEGWGCTEGHTLEFDYLSRFSLTPTAWASEVAAATARAEAAEQRATAAEAEVALLRTDSAILGRELGEANRLLLSGIPQQRGAAAERAAIAHTLRARAETLRDRKALGAAEEVEALAFYVEQRGVASEAQPAEVPNG